MGELTTGGTFGSFHFQNIISVVLDGPVGRKYIRKLKRARGAFSLKVEARIPKGLEQILFDSRTQNFS